MSDDEIRARLDALGATDPEQLRRSMNGHHDSGDGDTEAPELIFRSMADVEPREISFLWPGYIVSRKFNLIAGVGGVGKGQLMANLIARASRGDVMPYEVVSSVSQPRRALRTLILAAEDDPHEDLRPRLDANGANLANVLILDGVRVRGSDEMRWVDVTQHMPRVMRLVYEQQIDIVYIDPLSSYMPGVQRQNAGHVRDTLGHLQRLINVTGVTVVGTLHLGKSTDRRGAHRVLDSVEFVNAARNVIGVADLPDEHQPDDVLEDAKHGRRRVFAVLKSNSNIPGKPLLFSRPLNAQVQWHGESPVSFDDCFSAAAPVTRLEEAKSFLFETLKGGSKFEAEVSDLAAKDDITKATLRRAKRELRVKTSKTPGSKTSPWLWSLPPIQEQDAQPDGQGAHVDPDEHVEHLVTLSTTERSDEHLVESDQSHPVKSQKTPESSEGAQGAHREHLVPTKPTDGQGAQDAHVAHDEHLVIDEHLVPTERYVMDGEAGHDRFTF